MLVGRCFSLYLLLPLKGKLLSYKPSVIPVSSLDVRKKSNLVEREEEIRVMKYRVLWRDHVLKNL